MVLELDTGAGRNVISEELYSEQPSHVPLEPTAGGGGGTQYLHQATTTYAGRDHSGGAV